MSLAADREVTRGIFDGIIFEYQTRLRRRCRVEEIKKQRENGKTSGLYT
jgi:hypothetical protein